MPKEVQFLSPTSYSSTLFFFRRNFQISWCHQLAPSNSFSMRVERIGDLLITNVLLSNYGGDPGGTGKVLANRNNNEPDFLLYWLGKYGMFSENFCFGGKRLGNKGNGLISWFILYHLSPRIKSPITFL